MKTDGITPVIVVLCTAPPGSAHAIAADLINRHLAACVNIIPVESVYRWEGTVCDEPEELMIIKTTSNMMEKLTESLVNLHPYNVPEIISLPVTGGFTGYLSWVANEVQYNGHSG